MGSTITPMRWIVKSFDANAQKIVDYDVLQYRENFIKELKRKYKTIEEFTAKLKIEMMSQYWSRCEWEVIIKKTDDHRIILYPWCGCRDIDSAAVDVTDDERFDWEGFANEHIARQIFIDEAKIDVYDQLMYRWDEFVKYCWEYRHKYQRIKKG